MNNEVLIFNNEWGRVSPFTIRSIENEKHCNCSAFFCGMCKRPFATIKQKQPLSTIARYFHETKFPNEPQSYLRTSLLRNPIR